MPTVFGFGRAGAVEFFHQALDFGGVMLARRTPFSQPEQQIAAAEFGELDAANAQAHAPIVFDHALHAGERSDALPRFRLVGRGAAARLQARVQIAMVARVDAHHEVLLGIGEQLEARGRGVEAQQAQGCGPLAARRNVDGQALHRHPPFAPAQVREPDQAERKNRRRVAFGRRGNGRPAVLPVAQKGAREGGREAEFQVRLGA